MTYTAVPAQPAAPATTCDASARNAARSVASPASPATRFSAARSALRRDRSDTVRAAATAAASCAAKRRTAGTSSLWSQSPATSTYSSASARSPRRTAAAFEIPAPFTTARTCAAAASGTRREACSPQSSVNSEPSPHTRRENSVQRPRYPSSGAPVAARNPSATAAGAFAQTTRTPSGSARMMADARPSAQRPSRSRAWIASSASSRWSAAPSVATASSRSRRTSRTARSRRCTSRSPPSCSTWTSTRRRPPPGSAMGSSYPGDTGSPRSRRSYRSWTIARCSGETSSTNGRPTSSPTPRPASAAAPSLAYTTTPPRTIKVPAASVARREVTAFPRRAGRASRRPGASPSPCRSAPRAG